MELSTYRARPADVNGFGAAMVRSQVMPASESTKVLVVDDHELLRIGIRTILKSAERASFEIIEAANLHDAMDAFRGHADIALVLLDLNMPDCRGLQGLKCFLEAFPSARVAVLSGTQDEFVVGQVRALGAVGYLTKGQAPASMIDIVLALTGQHAGESAGMLQMSAQGSPGFSRFPKSSKYDRVAELGPRHLEILDYVLFGCSNQEISTSAGLSLGTVKNYVSTILLAMDVKSRSHLISLFR